MIFQDIIQLDAYHDISRHVSYDEMNVMIFQDISYNWMNIMIFQDMYLTMRCIS